MSDEDFAALQEKVKALEVALAKLDPKVNLLQSDVSSYGSELVNLQADFDAYASTLNNQANAISTLNNSVVGLQYDVSAHDTELTALGNSMNSIEQSSSKKLWLYDGNKVKKHPVVAVQDLAKGGQEAIVELEPGLNARYLINRFAVSSSTQSPQKLSGDTGSDLSLAFTLDNCFAGGGIAYLELGSLGDFGQAGAIGSYLVAVTASAETPTGITLESTYNGSCSSTGTSISGRVYKATITPISLFTYPNPLTVGP